MPMACIGLLAGALASCDTDKTIEYQEAPLSPTQPYFFALQPTQEIQVGDEDYQVFFNVFRSDTIPDQSVNLIWEGDTSSFLQLPSEAVFNGTDLETQGEILFDSTTFDPTRSYNIKVTIEGTETTPYSQNYLEFSFNYYPMSPWEPYMADAALGRDGTGIYYFSQYYSGYSFALVESRYSLLNENIVQYRFQMPIDNNNPSLGWETFITAASDDGGKTIYVPEQEFAYNPTYGIVYVIEGSHYNAGTGSGGSYFDEESGTFYLDVIYFVDAGYFGYGYETCTLFGFADTNSYSVTLTDGGTFSLNGDNYQLVNFNWSETVALVAYTVVDTASVTADGEINDDEVWKVAEGMLTGATQYTIVNEKGLQALSFPKSGDYTVIAAGFKAENDGSATLKATGTLSFKYTFADPNQGWESLGYLEYTDGYITSMYGADAQTYYVEVQQNEDYPGYHRLVDPYGAAYPYNEAGDWNPNVTSYLYFDISNPNCCYVDVSQQTLDWGDGELLCYSYAAYILANGGTVDAVIAEDAAGTYKNKELTFPFQSLLMAWGESNTLYFANFVVDMPATEAAGEVQFEMGPDGKPVAPFKVNFNTLTENPVAAATRSVYSNSFRKNGLNLGNMKPVEVKKQPRYVKYKGEKLNVGNLTPFRSLQTL